MRGSGVEDIEAEKENSLFSSCTIEKYTWHKISSYLYLRRNSHQKYKELMRFITEYLFSFILPTGLWIFLCLRDAFCRFICSPEDNYCKHTGHWVNFQSCLQISVIHLSYIHVQSSQEMSLSQTYVHFCIWPIEYEYKNTWGIIFIYFMHVDTVLANLSPR